MTKADVVSALAQALGGSRTDANTVVDALFGLQDGIIPQALARGESVALRGFGVFEVRRVAPRLARNPKTGAPVQTAASLRPAFRPSAGLKRHVNG